MWVKTIFGNRLNLDHIINISVKEIFRGEYSHHLVGYGPNYQSGMGDTLVLHAGTEKECEKAGEIIDHHILMSRITSRMNMVALNTMESTKKEDLSADNPGNS